MTIHMNKVIELCRIRSLTDDYVLHKGKCSGS